MFADYATVYPEHIPSPVIPAEAGTQGRWASGK